MAAGILNVNLSITYNKVTAMPEDANAIYCWSYFHSDCPFPKTPGTKFSISMAFKVMPCQELSKIRSSGIVRVEGEGYVHYKAMLISVVLQVLLLMFEVLVCDKLENNRHWWILIFVPLILISIISIVVCIWAVKHDRSFELELFCSVNILQFIFLALRLDEIIMWNWVVVFVPLWIVMCMAVIGVLYAIIFASILLRTPEVLLSNKLDSESSLTYAATCIPLYFTFIVLIFLAFGSKGGNHCSFYFKCMIFITSFFHIVRKSCSYQEYGNISYSLHSNEPEDNEPPVQSVTCGKPTYSHSKKKNLTSQSELRVVVPALSIETPD
ncbi:transmembrane protein 185B [Trichonephila clavipes]|nr:transmembrane protein 185B [Trichonephila clavipes]